MHEISPQSVHKAHGRRTVRAFETHNCQPWTRVTSGRDAQVGTLGPVDSERA